MAYTLDEIDVVLFDKHVEYESWLRLKLPTVSIFRTLSLEELKLSFCGKPSIVILGDEGFSVINRLTKVLPKEIPVLVWSTDTAKAKPMVKCLSTAGFVAVHIPINKKKDAILISIWNCLL